MPAGLCSDKEKSLHEYLKINKNEATLNTRSCKDVSARQTFTVYKCEMYENIKYS